MDSKSVGMAQIISPLASCADEFGQRAYYLRRTASHYPSVFPKLFLLWIFYAQPLRFCPCELVYFFNGVGDLGALDDDAEFLAP